MTKLPRTAYLLLHARLLHHHVRSHPNIVEFLTHLLHLRSRLILQSIVLLHRCHLLLLWPVSNLTILKAVTRRNWSSVRLDLAWGKSLWLVFPINRRLPRAEKEIGPRSRQDCVPPCRKRSRVDSSRGSGTATQTVCTESTAAALSPTPIVPKEIGTINVHINNCLTKFQQSMEHPMNTLQTQLNATLVGLETRINILINQRTNPPTDLEDLFDKY